MCLAALGLSQYLDNFYVPIVINFFPILNVVVSRFLKFPPEAPVYWSRGLSYII